MKSIRIVFVTLVAVFAFSAVAASSALASPEWYVKKAGVFAKVKESVKVLSTDTLELIDTKYGTPPPFSNWGISCEGTDLGVIKAGGTGEITSFSINKCEPAKIAENACEEVEGWKAPHLAWKTELYAEGGTIRDRIVSGGSGTPEWVVQCKTAFPFSDNSCGINTSTLMTNNVSGGLVESAFDKTSNKTSCTKGGEKAGEWKGVLKIEPTESEKKAGVEAIKVE
jgi:hypothetical protein